MSKIVISLSGGLDSAVLLSKLVTEGHEIFCVNFQYGSKHNPYEKESADRIAAHYGRTLFHVDLSEAFVLVRSNLLKGDGEIPEGHYEAESMKQTVVPGRNLTFLAVLAGFAESIGAQHVAIGAHAGDHTIYPDCRPGFINAAGEAITASSNGQVSIVAPFMWITKTQIVRVGQKFETPFAMTRTCYKDQPIACGKCGSCQERLQAFFEVGEDDPLEYESRTLIPRKR